MSFRGLPPVKPRPPATKPLFFIVGNMTRGKARTPDTEFYDADWLDFVKTTPHGRVLVGTGDHWIFHEAARLVNAAIEDWLGGLGVGGATVAVSAH